MDRGFITQESRGLSRVECQFQPELIYIYTPDSNIWNKTDYTSPAAGELQGMKEPFSFWLRLLKYTEMVEQQQKTEQETYYAIRLQPFRDEVHGIRFEDVESAVMNIWTGKEPFGIRRMELNVVFKSNIIRGYNQINYTVEFRDINRAPAIRLPREAQSANKLTR